MGPLFSQHLFPDHPPIPPTKRHRAKLMAMRHWHAVVYSGGIIMNRLLCCTHRGHREQVNRVPENDWRGMAFARYWYFPTNIICLAPLGRRIGSRCDAVGQRSAPRRPIVEGRACANAGIPRQNLARPQTGCDQNETRSHHAHQYGHAKLTSMAKAQLKATSGRDRTGAIRRGLLRW